jgi:hypothetical protein
LDGANDPDAAKETPDQFFQQSAPGRQFNNDPCGYRLASASFKKSKEYLKSGIDD